MIARRPPAEPITPKGRETKRALLDAGERVAAGTGLAGLSVAAVAAAAGVAKGTFYVHFADRDEFVDALRERFLQHVEATVRQAVDGMPPGRDFLAAVVSGYLDACRAQSAVKGLLLEARPSGGRPSDPTLEERFEELVGPSLAEVGLTPVRVHARFLAAIAGAAASMEAAGDERARAAVHDWLAGVPLRE